MSLTPQELLGAQEWNKLIKVQIENALGSKLDGDFVAANYPAGFNYAVKQQYYNGDSLSTLNSLVTVTDDIPTLGGTFSTLYKNVIADLEYGFSQTDLNQMNQEETKQGALVGTIINLYKNSGLDDTPEDYPTILFILKRIKEVTGTDYSSVDFRVYPNLAPLCRNLSEYARLGSFTMKMESRWSQAADRMEAINGNISNPSGVNGGIKIDGETYSIGWDKLPETETLLAELKQGSSVSFSLSTDSFKENSSNVHFENDVTVKVPFNWFFDVKVNHEHSYDFSKYARNDSELSVSVTFNGITILGAVPTPLADNNVKGWFAWDILEQAAEKSGKDETGYRLHGGEFDPDLLFGKNGQLRRLKTFVISQQPIISLHFKKFDSEEMQKIFSEKTEVDYSLFGGIVSGTHNNSYTFTDYKYDEKEQTLDVTITPAPIGDSGSIGKQTAFILGGVPEAYGKN